MYFLLFAAALPVVYMVWNKASNKWQLPPPSVFLTAEPKSRQHAVNETFVSAEVVIMMGSLSLLPSLYPQLSVCTHHHYTDLLPFTPVDTFRIMAGAIFEKLDRAALPAPALRAAAGRTSIIIIVLIWSWGWSWAGVDLSFDSSLGGSLGRVLWPRPLVPHCPMVPGPGLSAVYTFTLSDQIWHSIRRGKVGTFIGRIKGSAGCCWPGPGQTGSWRLCKDASFFTPSEPILPCHVLDLILE